MAENELPASPNIIEQSQLSFRIDMNVDEESCDKPSQDTYQCTNCTQNVAYDTQVRIAKPFFLNCSWK